MAKTSLVESLPEMFCKWLNAAGVSAENRWEIITAGAVTAIFYASMSLRNDLRAMAAEKQALQKQNRKVISNGEQATQN